MKAFEYVQKGWTQHTSARNALGEPIMPRSVHAVEWCAIGAIGAACLDHASDFEAWLARRLPGGLRLDDWNDAPERTKEEVVMALALADGFYASKVKAACESKKDPST